ncbi:PAS domain S-box protein [Thermosulfurimonas marina]|uniref:histidine kinase n=1 Tax=Thermosulfurimonas marina TaxID=2047767 RepID=A0A6H1WSH0_9BACT|nr:PAS domain S-box protein [Thermosulfurimonas marina]QJA06076.1 PAS domain S-box protein [Thermosulfurimonas marina]
MVFGSADHSYYLDYLPEGVMLLDAEGRIIYVNQALARLLGRSREDLLGKKCYEVVHGSGKRPSFCVDLCMREEARSTSALFYEPHLQCLLWAYAAPIKDEKGRIVGCFHLVRPLASKEAGGFAATLVGALMDLVPGPCYLADQDYYILLANQALQRMVGEEVSGRKCYEVIAGRDFPCEECLAERVFQEGKVESWEVRFPLDGRWYLALSGLWRDPLTGRSYRLSLFWDIHERKVLEKRLQALFEESPAALVVTTPEGEILMANRAFRALLKLPEKAELSRLSAWDSWVDSRDRQRFLEQLALKGEVSGREVRLGDMEGGERTFILSSRLFSLERGQEIWTHLQDITALKEAERALVESEARFRTLAESAPLAIILMDEEGKVTYFNPAAERMFGFREEEVLGRDLHLTLAPPEYHERYLRAFKRVKESGKSRLAGQAFQFQALRRDGTRFPVEIYFSILEFDGRRLFLGLVQDITARKRLEEERLRMEKYRALELLAGGVAHDLNNLLTSLIGNLELLEMYLEDKRAREILERAEKVASQARHLARDLLIFSKGDVPVPKEVVLRDFLQDFLKFLLHGQPVRLHLEIPPGLPPIRMDISHLTQLIQNLVFNALEVMPEGGDLFVQAEPREEEVILVFRDTGPGIPPEILPRIFEPGFTTKPAGTGLGLAVVKSVVERYGGRVEVFSSPGLGTTFRLCLPLAKGEGGRPAEEKEVPSRPQRFSGRALVMDDEESIRVLLSEALSYLGLEVETASEGGEALQKFEKARAEGRPFDLLILDLTVPGGKGALWVAERLRGEKDLPPLILSTGYSLEAETLGDKFGLFADILRKPYTLAELSALLKRHLPGA